MLITRTIGGSCRRMPSPIGFGSTARGPVVADREPGADRPRVPAARAAAIGFMRTSSRVSSPAATRGATPRSSRTSDRARRRRARVRARRGTRVSQATYRRSMCGHRQRVGHAEAGQVGHDHAHARQVRDDRSRGRGGRHGSRAPPGRSASRRTARTPSSAWCGRRPRTDRWTTGVAAMSDWYGESTGGCIGASLRRHPHETPDTRSIARLSCPGRALDEARGPSTRSTVTFTAPIQLPGLAARPAVVQALGLLRGHGPLVRRFATATAPATCRA